MELYEFEKSLTTRFKEFSDILQWEDSPISASEIRNQWSYYVEIAVEPRGWQALWKIPRVICEESKIRYPTTVLGTVDQVLFKELKASFIITAVEEDDVNLPENQEVLLEDLWVTKDQENTAIDIEKTANCIDQLRFFYKNIWMPWDNDNDDLDWVKKHLQTRIQFYDDVKKMNMKRSVATHIKSLLLEARHIQSKCDYLEMVLDDDESDELMIDNNVSKEQITDLMKLHLRMATIKGEIELLENPVMRKVYEDMKTDRKSYKNGIVYVITVKNTITKQINILKTIENLIDDDQPVLMLNSLQEALDDLKSSDQIILSSGEHYIKFVENLNNGMISGLNDNDNHKAVLKSKDDDILLITITGNFVLKNLILDCRNVRNGIFIKDGHVSIENCEIIGDNLSSSKKGIVLVGNSKLTLNNCTIRNFGIGLSVNGLSTVHLNQSKIFKCKIGLELEDNTHITFDENPGCSIKNSQDYGIWYETKMFDKNMSQKKIILANKTELKKEFLCGDLPWTGNCTFENNKKGNIIIWNRNVTFSNSLLSTPNKLSDSFKDIVDISSDSYESMTDNEHDDDNDCSTLDTSEDNKIVSISIIDDSVITVDD